MSSTVEQIKDRLTIQDVVGSYVKLERAGKNLRARCPFHNEKTPSFFVSPDRGVYHCFGCGRGGDMFSFVEEFEGVDFPGALRVLAGRAGVEVAAVDRRTEDARQRLFTLLADAAAHLERNLAGDAAAQAYLVRRGLSAETVKAFRLGYAKDTWRDLYDALTGRGYTDAELEQVGLLKRSEGGRRYDTFRGRIMFPILDSAGRTIAFSGRIFPEKPADDLPAGKAEAPKYLNTPETALFKKSEVLYAFEHAKSSIRRHDFCIVVEGQLDVLLAHQAGYRSTVAPLGTALTVSHLTRIHKLTQNLLFAFDADSAGHASFQRAAAVALSMGFDVKVASLPAGSDPAELIAHDPDAWKRSVKEARHTIDFLLTTLRADAKDDRAFKQSVSRAVLPFVSRIASSIDQAHFVGTVAAALSVPERAIYAELEKLPAGELPVEGGAPEPPEHGAAGGAYSRREATLRRIVGLLGWQEHLAKPSVDTGVLRERLGALVGVGNLPTLSETEREEYAFEAELSLEGAEKLTRHLDELMLALEEELLREELESSLAELKVAEEEDDNSLVSSLLARCQELARKIEYVRREFQQTQ